MIHFQRGEAVTNQATLMKNILIRRVDNLGDIILAMPVFKALRAHFKHARFTFMVKPEHRPLVQQFADDFLSPLPLEEFAVLAKVFDHCINIEYSLPASYKPNKSKLPPIIHVGTANWKRALHVSQHLVTGLKLHGMDVRYAKAALVINSEVQEKASQWFAANNIDQSNRLVISVDPNSGFDRKCWSIQGFAVVCKYLVKEFNAVIIIPVATQANERAQHLLQNLPEGSCYVLAGESIDMVAAIIKKCDLHLGNDSGIGHLASAVNTPTVSIFGPTDAALWKPYGNKSIVVMKPEISCPGGYEHAMQCSAQKCLSGIKPKDVIDGILYCFTKYVNREKLFSLANMQVSPHLSIQKSRHGYILQNNLTEHACIVKDGWREVKQVLSNISSKPVHFLLTNQPAQKPLIDMLVMHRILVPSPNTSQENK
jgi:ADP-heptose:LPS heptosyltransferase